MSNITFGQLPNQPSITGTTIIPTVSANTNYTVTVSNLQAYITANSSGSYSNANATSLMANFGSNVISTTGNVTTGNLNLTSGHNITGDFSNGNTALRNYFQTTQTGTQGFTALGLIPNATNTNLLGSSFRMFANANTLANQSISLFRTFSNISGTGNIQISSDRVGANATDYVPIRFVTGGSDRVTIDINGNVGIGNLLPGDRLVVAGNITATGNVAGTYFIGNGSQLTGISAGSNYSNANVVGLMANFGSNTISTSGNITGGFILGNGSQLTGITSNYSNANVANYLPVFSGNISAGNVSAVGNVAGNYFLGNGSQLTGVIATSDLIISGTNYANMNATVSGNSGVQIRSANTVQIQGNTFSGYLSQILIDSSGGMTLQAYNTISINTGGAGSLTVSNRINTFSLSAYGNVDVGSYLNTQFLAIQSSSTPLGNSTGVLGQMTWNSSYLYICTGTNTWKRIALSSF
jgi:hypothetical protein